MLQVWPVWPVWPVWLSSEKSQSTVHVAGAKEPAAKDQPPSLQRLLQKGPEGMRYDTEAPHGATMAR